MHDRLFRQCYELMNSNGKACRAYIKTLSDYDPYRDRKCPPKKEISYPYFPVHYILIYSFFIDICIFNNHLFFNQIRMNKVTKKCLIK